MRIVLVEEDASARAQTAALLAEQGFEVSDWGGCKDLLPEIRRCRPDALLLDLPLPGDSRFEAVRELRADSELRLLPIIILSGPCSEDDRVRALDLGADDYVTKPILPKELGARIKAVVRRSAGATTRGEEKITVGELLIDLASHRVLLRGSSVSLTLTEFRILAELCRVAGFVLTREQLRTRALGNLNVSDRTIDVHMTALRKKLLDLGESIQTVRGVGYRLNL